MGTQANTELELISMTGVQTRMNAKEEQVLLDVLRNAPSLSTGEQGAAFEREWSAFIGCIDSVSVCNCSAALELSAILSGAGPGDEVILPAHTFVSSAVPFGRTGATLRWADIESDTFLISAKSVESMINEKTKVIVVVHLYGMPADMDAIMSLANQNGIMVVEDCAQAPGAKYKGRRVGSMGHFGCFSFHTHKNITTLGEGGMLTVQDKPHGEAARRLRWMGNWPFEGERQRYWLPAMSNLVEPIAGQWPHNYCMGEPNCAVGRLLMKRLDAIDNQRRSQARRFIGGLADFPELNFQKVPPDHEHAYHLMAARYDGGSYGKTRDDLIQLLFEKYKIKCLVHYWPLNRSELFRSFGFEQAKVPDTDHFFDNMLGFPWWSNMGDELVDDMAGRTCDALQELRS